MVVTTTIDMTVPIWGIAVSLVAGAYFIVNMNLKITLLEREMQLQKKTLDEIKEMFYEFVKPKK